MNAKQAAARDPNVTATAKIIGPSIILDAFSKRLGLPKVLKAC
ncbi:hypothetical protein SCG7086_DK_00030 [Chlamydiales bacterium SCGC AG-110-P3]|nr:hypothetical protein SCG7086_DK_00030 [Chlamydiales bacterium SCGC AG-110-P3]